MIRTLDLFAGIGGFSLGLEWSGGFETIAFCEIDGYAQKVLKKNWPDIPIYEDVRELNYDKLKADGLGGIDCITGGYPCQPFSQAGKRKGDQDDRHLWPEVNRLVATIRPRWCIFENVAGHVSMGLDEVLSDLEGQGYTAWPLIIPACALDAPHRRDRVWIVAHTGRFPSWAGEELDGDKTKRGKGGTNTSNSGEAVANANRERRDGCTAKQRPQGGAIIEGNSNVPNPDNSGCQQQWGAKSDEQKHPATECRRGWELEPAVGRVANGIPKRVDRLRCLGNAVVPQIPMIIGQMIMGVENGNHGA